MNRHTALVLAAALVTGVPLAASAATPPAIVHIKNFAFVPPSLTVRAGTVVTFVNDDDEPHTATAYDKSFDSEALDSHETWKYTFAKAGTYNYFCEMHPRMKGTLVVTPAT
jgi:plastocyanin